MKTILVAFDIDGTLINPDETPNLSLFQVLVSLSAMQNVEILVWSGSGADYASMIVNRYGLGKYVQYIKDKSSDIKPDIAFDDQPDFSLADKNIIV